MKKILIVVAYVLIALGVQAQTFNGTGGPIPGSSTTATCFPINVSGIGNINTISKGLSGVCLNLTHPVTSEVEIVLKAPDGTVIPLSMQNDGTNYTNTCFSATAATSIKFSNTSHTGTFIPEGYLGTVNDGQNADGTWNLCVRDRRTGSNAGSLTDWSLTFSNTPAAMAPTIPACANTLPANSSCANATAVCDFNGLCGTTSGSTVQSWTGSGLDGCFGLENNSFIKFTASSTTASFSVWVPTSTRGNDGGIQMIFFSGNCNAGAVTSYGCYPHILPYQSGSPVATIVTATGLTVGNTYYLMFDGFGGDAASFRIAANSGINVLNINPAAPAYCTGGNVNITASGSDGTYTWSPGGGLNTTTGPTVNASPGVTSTYTVSTTTSTGCLLTKDVTVTVNNFPAITTQPSTAVQNVCQNKPVTALAVVANAGSGTVSGYQWYVTTNNNNTSGTPIPFATSASYTPSSANVGTVYFYCKVTNSNGCITTSNVSGALIVSPLVATPTASATVQPTCALPTGTIVVTLPAGANIQYSVDGINYQASGTFAGLAPAVTYNVTAKNISTGCISAIRTVVINAAPAGPAVSASVTLQPTCALPTGTITISSPTGADYEYSVGNAYQTGTVFSGLTNSTTYNVTLRQVSTGCISPALPLAVSAITGAPAKPSATVTHPDCNIATGTITVVTPLNANYEYSVGGAYQTTLSFTSLIPGNNYSVTVKDIITGCVSAPFDTAISIFAPVASPIISSPVTYCQNEAATVLTATGSNLKWYATLTTTTVLPSAPVPSTATAGNIKYYVSQTIAGCESTRDSITVTINPTPALPITTGNTTTYCENANATVLTATGTNLQWYNVATGGSPLPSAPIPNTFAPGNLAYYVTQTVNGCESGRAAIAITINATPASPAIANPNIQYCLNTPANPLTATGSNLKWYNAVVNGTQYPAAPVPSTANTGSTFYYVSQTVNGCESGRDMITVTVVAVATPPVTAPVDYCLNQTPSALTAGGIGLKWYSTLTSTAALPAAPVPVTTVVGSTKYYVSQLVNGCESKRDSIEVTVKPASAAPGVISPLEFCQNTTAPALTATGTNLLWYTSATGSTGSATAPTPQTATPATTFYYVTQNTNGCESTPRTAITVTINLTSTAVAGFQYSADTYCLNAITAPAPSYDVGFTFGGTFTSTPAGLNINAITGDITLPSSSTGIYNVTYTYNTTGCVNGNTSTKTITLNPPIPTELRFSYSSPVCKDAAPVIPQTFTNFTTGGTFTSIPSTGLSIDAAGVVDVSNSLPGFYTVIYNVTEQGCRNADSKTAFITINDTSRPVTKFDYSSTDICLLAGVANPAITKATGFTTGGVFAATPAGLNINSSTGDVNIGLSSPATYKIKYSVPALGCRLAGSDSLILKLKAYGNPVTSFSYAGPVCRGDGNAAAVPGANFTEGGTYSAVTAGLVVDAATGSIDLRQSIPGNHTIKYEVVQGVCNPAGSSTASITVLAQPEAPSITPASICGAGNIVLNASASGTISWYTEAALITQIYVGSSFPTVINNTTAYYVTNTVGICESEPAIANAIVNPVPVKPFLGGDTSICPNEKLILRAGNYTSYLWQDGTLNSTYTVSNPGNYKVIVSTAPGCSDSADINISIVEDCNDITFPNAFAPNGLNKTFGALGNTIPVSKYSLRVYNRYGQEIFVATDPLKRWDGTFQGKPVNIGSYVYVATYLYKNRIDRVKKGTVTVVR